MESQAITDVASAWETARILAEQIVRLQQGFLRRADDARRITVAAYREGAVPLVQVLDASRAVGVVSTLLSDDLKGQFDEKTRADYARLREEHAAKSREKKLISLEQARANRTPIDWASYTPPKPELTFHAGRIGPT